jgi:hypothetical protein
MSSPMAMISSRWASMGAISALLQFARPGHTMLLPSKMAFRMAAERGVFAFSPPPFAPYARKGSGSSHNKVLHLCIQSNASILLLRNAGCGTPARATRTLDAVQRLGLRAHADWDSSGLFTAYITNGTDWELSEITIWVSRLDGKQRSKTVLCRIASGSEATTVLAGYGSQCGADRYAESLRHIGAGRDWRGHGQAGYVT